MNFEMTCQTVPQWMDPFLDSQLDVATAHGVVQHLGHCTACSWRFENEEKLRDAVRRSLMASPKAPGDFWGMFIHQALHRTAPISLVALVDAATRAHRRVAEELKIPGASEAEILAYYRGAAGYLPCPGHVGPLTKTVGDWKSAGVLRDVFPGHSLASKTYRGESSVATQLSMPREYVGLLNAGELRFPFYTFDRGAASVSVMECPGNICLFVTEGKETTRRARQELYREFCTFVGTSKPTLPENRNQDW